MYESFIIPLHRMHAFPSLGTAGFECEVESFGVRGVKFRCYFVYGGARATAFYSVGHVFDGGRQIALEALVKVTKWFGAFRPPV